MQHHQLVTAATALCTLPETDVPIQLTVMCVGRKAILLRPVAAKGRPASSGEARSTSRVLPAHSSVDCRGQPGR